MFTTKFTIKDYAYCGTGRFTDLQNLPNLFFETVRGS